MKKILTAVIAAVMIVVAGMTSIEARKAVSRDSQPGTRTETLRASRHFTSLILDGVADYELIADPSREGVIEIKYTLPKGGMEKMVIVEDRGSNLKIDGGFKTPAGAKYSDKAKMKIKVYYSTLNGIETRGTGDIKTPSIDAADSFTLLLNGTGDINTGRLTTKNLIIKLSGTGDIETMQIDCNRANISLNGTGDIEIKGLKARDVAMENSGTGDLEPGVVDCDVMSLRNSGTGDVTVKGGSARTLTVGNPGSGDIKIENYSYGNINVAGGRIGTTKINGKKY